MENKQSSQTPLGTDSEAVETDVVIITEQEAPKGMKQNSLWISSTF